MNQESTLRIDELKRGTLLAALERFEGNRTRAAEAMGISIRTCRNWIRKYRVFDHGRELLVEPGARVVCPECWAPVAVVRQGIYRYGEMTVNSFEWPWKPAVVGSDMLGRCWWKGCGAKWFDGERIHTSDGWIPNESEAS